MMVAANMTWERIAPPQACSCFDDTSPAGDDKDALLDLMALVETLRTS
jgi:hypothetical protein